MLFLFHTVSVQMWSWGAIHHIKQLEPVLVYMTSYTGQNGAIREELFECLKGYSSLGKGGKQTMTTVSLMILRKRDSIKIISLSRLYVLKPAIKNTQYGCLIEHTASRLFFVNRFWVFLPKLYFWPWIWPYTTIQLCKSWFIRTQCTHTGPCINST